MKKNPIETVLGILVLLVACLFATYAAKKINIRPQQGYELHAEFLKSGGIQSGSDVRISGIKVGSVINIELSENFTAKLVLTVKDSIKIPENSVASIVSDGLMGDTIIEIEPGNSPENLKPGDSFKKTKDFRSLETMIGDIIFSGTEE